MTTWPIEMAQWYRGVCLVELNVCWKAYQRAVCTVNIVEKVLKKVRILNSGY